MVLVLSFDNDFARIIARKLRSEHVYCKVTPGDIDLAEVQRQNPAGLVLVGGVVARGRQGPGGMDVRMLDMGLPLLALGSAARTLCEAMGGERGEGTIEKKAATVTYAPIPLFAGIETGERWLEHAHDLRLPEGLVPAAEAEGITVGFAHTQKPLFGLQFQIENNDPDGLTMLSNFVLGVCGCTTWWSTEAFVERAKEDIHHLSEGQGALCSVSGGLDSTVCALLAHQALGERLHCVLVDTGLMRRDEARRTQQDLQALGLRVTLADRRAETLQALAGCGRIGAKQQAVRGVLTQTLQAEALALGGCHMLLRGTNYTDIMLREEPGPPQEDSCGSMRILEPLRDLFRDEVYRAGELLAVPPQILHRQPFPFTGLAARVWGEVSASQLDLLREADDIFAQEIEQAGQERKLWKYYAALAPMPGEGDTYQVLLRAVYKKDVGTAPARIAYDLLERTVERILAQPGIARVLYDITPSAHGDVGWK
jgi:GMP synthase (glutamine-hydrolysing)